MCRACRLRRSTLRKATTMNYHIKEIYLNETFDRYSIKGDSSNPSKIIPNLSKINIFVGANNSGKSRFLRQLASTEKVSFAPAANKLQQDSSSIDYNDLKEELLKNIKTLFESVGLEEANSILFGIQKIPHFVPINEGTDILDKLSKLLNYILSIQQLERRECKFVDGLTGDLRMNEILRNVLPNLKAQVTISKEKLARLATTFPTEYVFQKLYIPTLRGLRTLNDATDVYTTRTERDYFSDLSKGVSAKPEIFTGLTLYRDIRKLLLGNLAEREIIAEFQRFIGDNFFEGKTVALIPKEDSTVLDIKIGDEIERPVYQLGDGIQSIIIMTFPLYLHPGLQRILLTVFNNFPDYQYFLTTHSNHFLDITLDLQNVSVYTFIKELETAEKKERDATFEITNVSNEDRRALELLGVRNSSVFLSNCTIWVEGITDRRYLSHFLELYQMKIEEEATKNATAISIFKEDLHFSFVEYGGSNITHWSFLDNEDDAIRVESLCGKLFLITDKDNSKAKSERHEKLRAKLGARYYCLLCKEIENILMPHVIKSVVNKYENNSTDINAFFQEEYKDAPLGTFIESRVLAGKQKRKGSYASESGTVSDKVNFCQFAIASLQTFEDLSPEAKDLIKNIYTFIKENNR